MRFISTRGAAPAVGFTEALLSGLAPDGGLYAPQQWPLVSRSEIASFADAPYADVEIPHTVMRDLCVQAYATSLTRRSRR
jgi:threonine synthase